jgi:hypothetical protein
MSSTIVTWIRHDPILVARARHWLQPHASETGGLSM